MKKSNRLKMLRYILISKAFWILLVASFSVYVPFFGYSYLKYMLEGAGFTSPVINPNINDLVVYFLIGVGPTLEKLVSIDVLYLLAKIVFFSAILMLFILTSITIISKIKIDEDKKTPKSFSDFISERVHSATTSFKSFIISWVIATVTFALCYWFIILVVILLFIAPWLVAFWGSMKGQEQGRLLAAKEVCITVENEDISKPTKGCSKIKIEGDDKKTLSGRRIFQDDKTIFFVTNDGAYEINKSDRKISFFVPTFKPVEIDSNDNEI